MLSDAAEVWDAPQSLSGEILDVGCGLGGGSIFWAQEFGARVTAVHLRAVARGSRRPLCGGSRSRGADRAARLRRGRSAGREPLRRRRRGRRLRLSSAPGLARSHGLAAAAGRLGLHHRLLSRRPQIRGPVQQPLAHADRHARRIFRRGARQRTKDQDRSSTSRTEPCTSGPRRSRLSTPESASAETAPQPIAMRRRPKLIGSYGTAFRTADFATQCWRSRRAPKKERAPSRRSPRSRRLPDGSRSARLPATSIPSLLAAGR